jgi:tetratricopeptide (TPR) repeat protein
MTTLLVFTLLLAAQQHEGHGNAASPATLLPGLGRLHHPIATGNAEAQKFFDQGLTFIYAFNHDEAIRSFRRAAELDPTSPMPHWGIALALGPNINLDVDPAREAAAYEAAQRAKALAANAPPNERAYVDAVARRYSNSPTADLKALAVQYKDAMRDLVRAYPDDLDAATLYAESLMDLNPWQLWSADGQPADGTLDIVSTLEGVLKRDSSHIGANHYYIHAVEASRTPNRAGPSAKRLETLVPGAGHLVHMPAHIYMRTGNYRGAVNSNARAAEIDREYIRTSGAAGVYPMMYYNHNLDFLASAAMMTGQYAEAKQAADMVVANATPMIAQMAELEPFAAKTVFVLLRFGRWQDVLALPAPDAQRLLLTAIDHYARGVAHAALGRAADAERERAAYAQARQKLPETAQWGYNRASAVCGVIDASLDAWIARARGDDESAIRSWRAAAAAEDRLAYNEPPDWFYPTRESLGAALLRAKRYAEAERVFRDDLARNPGNARSLFGVWQSLIAAKKPGASAEKQFRDAWKHADVQLTLADF